MRLAYIVLPALLTLPLTACSSSKSTYGGTDAASSAGGASAGGHKGTGGSTSTGSGGTAGAATTSNDAGHFHGTPECAPDGGSSDCERCLETDCCADFTACLADATCSKAFATYQTCHVVQKGGADNQSACYGAFAAAVKSTLPAVPVCILSGTNQCGKFCGSPGGL